MNEAPAGHLPEGFKPFQMPGPFSESCGPYYYRREEDGRYGYGFHAETRHTNPYGVVHGGVLVTFADTFMGRSVVAAAKCACATITLNTEFIAGGKPESWIEGRAEVTRTTRTLAFVRAEIWCGDEMLMTASGIWRLFPGRSAIHGGRVADQQDGGE